VNFILIFNPLITKLDENNIMHRDIKGSNIFLKAIDPKHPEKILLKLGDFGCSIKFKDVIGTSPARATGFMGTFRNYLFFNLFSSDFKLIYIFIILNYAAFMAPEVMARYVTLENFKTIFIFCIFF
jgi:serine/threonine protein kinase